MLVQEAAYESMKLRLEKDGSIRLPAEVRTILGVAPGEEVCLEPCEGGFRLSCRVSAACAG